MVLFLIVIFVVFVCRGVVRILKFFGLSLLVCGDVFNIFIFVGFGLFGCGGVDKILKFIGCGECVGDELVEDMIKFDLLVDVVVDLFFFELFLLFFFLVSGNLFFFSLGVGWKFF